MELKNDISIRGTLKSVDQYLNIKLDDIQVVEEVRWPHLVGRIRVHVGRRGLGSRVKDELEWDGGVGRSTLHMISRETQLICYASSLVFRQECVHPRERGEIRASTWCGGRYGVAGGRHTERYVSLGQGPA